MTEKIKEKITHGELVKGSHVFCGDPMLTEAMAMCGFDVLWIDMEHTAIDKERVLNCLIASKAGGAASFVRIPWNDPVMAKPIIDMGPDGIIFPYIRTVEDAKLAVASCTYPPAGIRGYGPLRALGYGHIPQCEFVDERYREMMRIIQIEHIDAVECLEELAEIEGIDGFIVGPNDLSGSLGHIGRTKHPDMIPVYDRIGSILKGTNKLFGVSMGYDEPVLKQWLERGVNTIFAGNDVGYVREGAVFVKNGLDEITKG